MTLNKHEVPDDIRWNSNEFFPGLIKTSSSDQTVWNNKSAGVKDVIIDSLNMRKIVSYGLPHIFNLNEKVNDRVKESFSLEDCRVISFDNLHIISRYDGDTIIRKSGEFPDEDLLRLLKPYKKLVDLLEGQDRLEFSILVHVTSCSELQLVGVIDHLLRELRNPSHTEIFGRTFGIPMATSIDFKTFDNLGKSPSLYNKTYYVHYRSLFYKVENNWYSRSLTLLDSVTLDKIVTCWAYYPARNYNAFFRDIWHINHSTETLLHLSAIKSAQKILFIAQSILAKKIHDMGRSKAALISISKTLPIFLNSVFWNVAENQAIRESTFKQIYFTIIKMISGATPAKDFNSNSLQLWKNLHKTVDKPLLLGYHKL